MSAREEILGRVRASLAAARARGETAEADPRDGSLAVHIAPADCVERFVARLESVGGRVQRVTNEAQALERFAAIVAEHDPRRIAHSDDALALRLAASTGRALVPASAGRAALVEADLGVSGAQFGVAETGSLVLRSESERHRLASLLPPVHVALLRASTIVGSLDDAFAELARGGPDAMDRAVTFITGPSRTADIELRVVVGVHGPGVLHVLLIEDTAKEGKAP